MRILVKEKKFIPIGSIDRLFSSFIFGKDGYRFHVL